MAIDLVTKNILEHPELISFFEAKTDIARMMCLSQLKPIYACHLGEDIFQYNLYEICVALDEKEALAFLFHHHRVSGKRAAKLLQLACQLENLDMMSYLLKYPIVFQHAAMHGNLILCNAADRGNLEIVKLLLEIPWVRATVAVDDNEVYCSALRMGHLEVMNYLLQIPEVFELETKARAQEFYHNILPHVSKSDDVFFEKVKNLLSQLPDALKNSAIVYNRILCNAVREGQVKAVRRLLAIPEVFSSAAMSQNMALRYALKKPHIEIVNCLLEVPSVMSGVEFCEAEYERPIHLFVDKKLEGLWQRKAVFKASHPHDVFTIKAEEVESYFYALRNLICRGVSTDYEQIHQLLQIPALANQAHLSLNGEYTNELLHLAQHHAHVMVAADLLTLPLVHALQVHQDNMVKNLEVREVEEKMVVSDSDEEQRTSSVVNDTIQAVSAERYDPRLFVEKRVREGEQEKNPHSSQRLRGQ